MKQADYMPCDLGPPAQKLDVRSWTGAENFSKILLLTVIKLALKVRQTHR
jgi:hypothetical protein